MPGLFLSRLRAEKARGARLWSKKASLAALAALAASTPASAQFMTNYPVIVVPPPPAQNIVVPKPKPSQAPKPNPPAASSASPEIKCRLQGQTRICE